MSDAKYFNIELFPPGLLERRLVSEIHSVMAVISTNTQIILRILGNMASSVVQIGLLHRSYLEKFKSQNEITITSIPSYAHLQDYIIDLVYEYLADVYSINVSSNKFEKINKLTEQLIMNLHACISLNIEFESIELINSHALKIVDEIVKYPLLKVRVCRLWSKTSMEGINNKVELESYKKNRLITDKFKQSSGQLGLFGDDENDLEATSYDEEDGMVETCSLKLIAKPSSSNNSVKLGFVNAVSGRPVHLACPTAFRHKLCQFANMSFSSGAPLNVVIKNGKMGQMVAIGLEGDAKSE